MLQFSAIGLTPPESSPANNRAPEGRQRACLLADLSAAPSGLRFQGQRYRGLPAVTPG